MGLTVSIPHQLGRVEARCRIEKGFAKIIHMLPGSAGTCTERWDGDRLIFGVGAMGQTVSGVVSVLDNAVTMDVGEYLAVWAEKDRLAGHTPRIQLSSRVAELQDYRRKWVGVSVKGKCMTEAKPLFDASMESRIDSLLAFMGQEEWHPRSQRITTAISATPTRGQ